MGDNWHGLRFPFKTTAQSLFGEPSDIDIINSSINFILNTSVGEYITLPEFGSELPRDLFEQNDFVLKSLIIRHVTDALTRWEPRISVFRVNSNIGEHDVRLFIEYSLVAAPGEVRFFEDTFERNPV
jgi:phage baseplate assembly protein W